MLLSICPTSRTRDIPYNFVLQDEVISYCWSFTRVKVLIIKVHYSV